MCVVCITQYVMICLIGAVATLVVLHCFNAINAYLFNIAKIATKLFDFEKKMEGAQSMRWVEMEKISDNDFTFIIDKRVGEMLSNKLK